jgi:hypothetical protein
MNRCPVCSTLGMSFLNHALGPDSSGLDCPRCGRYYLTGTAITVLPRLVAEKKLNASLLSHNIRLWFDGHERPMVLFEEDLKPYQEDLAYIPPQQQFDNFILWIGSNQGAPHEWATADYHALAARAGTAVGQDQTEQGLTWLISSFSDLRLFSFRRNNDSGSYQLTPAGWTRFHELRRRLVNSRIAFMAMKFDDSVMSHVLSKCFKPAAERAGFTLRPLNEAPAAGLIDNQIRAAIRTARFVVADLTHDNNGAYFEAGFAEGLGVPVIYTCEAAKFKERKTHFDTNHMLTVPWDSAKLDEAGRELTATIRNTRPADAKPSDD